jgi:hypothetical protein
MLVPHNIVPTSSAVAKLFDYNKNNEQFLNGKYREETRTTVGDGFVVASADIAAAKETLATHLTPVSAMAKHGLRIRCIDLNAAGTVHTAAPVTVRFQIKRTPLSEQNLTSTDVPHTHAGMLTLGDAQSILGEVPVSGGAHSVSTSSTTAVDDVFKAEHI